MYALSTAPIDQWVWGQDDQRDWDLHYLVDAMGPRLTSLGRLSYAYACTKDDHNVAWAMCQGDIDQLDFASGVSR